MKKFNITLGNVMIIGMIIFDILLFLLLKENIILKEVYRILYFLVSIIIILFIRVYMIENTSSNAYEYKDFWYEKKLFRNTQ